MQKQSKFIIMKKIFLMLVIIFVGVTFSASAQIGAKKSVPKTVFDQKIYEICMEVASTMNKKDSTKIAISEFYTLDGPRSPYSRFLNEAITIELFKTKKFKILEKGRLEKVLKEQKMELNGQADGDVAKKLGKILDVKAILAGTIIDMGNTLRVNARLIDTGTGIIIAASTIELDKNMVIPSYPVEDKDVNPENNQQNQENQQGLKSSATSNVVQNVSAVAKSIKVSGSSLVYEVSFTNNGDIPDELDFASVVPVAGNTTELVSDGKIFLIESVIIAEGTTLKYSGKITLNPKETKTVLFKFQNAASKINSEKVATILAKQKSVTAPVLFMF
jgi:TolB-like protein